MERILDSFGIQIEFSSIHEQPEKLKELIYNYKVVVIKSDILSETSYLNFGRSIGRPTRFVDSAYFHPDYPEIFVVSNLNRDGKRFGMKRVGYYWHSDCSFLKNPLSFTMLHCHLTPLTGGETGFVDMGAAYRSLPESIKSRIKDKNATHDSSDRYIVVESDIGHSLREIRERDSSLCPPVKHPVVIRHFHTEEELLYLNPGFTTKIDDIDIAESGPLLKEIFDHVEKMPRYIHRWSPGDIVIWDNRSVIHQAFPYTEGSRLMYRIGLQEAPFFGDQQCVHMA